MTGGVAHVGTDPRLMVGENYPRSRSARRTQFPEQLGCRFDAGQTRPDDERSILPGRARLRREALDVVIEPCGAVVSIHIEGKFAEPRNVGTHQPAAQREDQPVIGDRSMCGTCGVGDLPAREIDTDDLAGHEVDVDRVEHLGERHSDAVQIGLVVPHPDRVPLVAIDHGHLDRFRADTELVQGARCAHRAPQPREPAAQNEDARRHRLVRSPIWRSTVWMTSKPSNSGCPR